MLVMNARGVDKLLSSKFTLGAEGSVAAGPVGRTTTAQTDAQMHAEILSWSRSQGLFAGLALKGATLRQDLDDNAVLYGEKLENRQIVTQGVRPPIPRCPHCRSIEFRSVGVRNAIERAIHWILRHLAPDT